MSETKRSYGAGISKTKLDYNDPMFLLEVEGMARDGYDDSQIAEYFDVAPETFWRNKAKRGQITAENPKGLSQVSLALIRGRRPLEVLVENSLYKLAMGMKVTTKTRTTRWMVIEGMGESPVEVVSETETETELPPNFNALHLWLRAKKADLYNVQPQRLDITSAGKELTGPPRITEIKHVVVSSDTVKKIEADT